ncbi:hypothetical protein JCM8202_000822 [Rhodotorula sphaerocarpa]
MSFSNAAATAPIQSLSVPSHVRVAGDGDPHVLYTVAVSLPTRTYSVQQRYSAFDALQQDLHKACGAPPPAALPPKHPASWFLHPLAAVRHLSDEQLDERRRGLELWLRAILADRDPRWRSSRAFKDFLAAPPESRAAGVDGTDAVADRDFSAAAWTAEHAALEKGMRQLRATLDRRDTQLLANSASAHGTAKEARTSLVDLVRRSGQLARGLQGLAREGMTDGELQRRSALVQQLQGEIEELGRKAGSAPRVGSGKRDGAEPAAVPPSAARSALLNGGSGSRAPARVLGAAAAASLETAETRPLDNEGVMQLQQQYMDDQDTKVESLTAALRRQRHLGELINQELALQEEVLDQLDTGTNRVQGRMKEANKQMKKL